MSATTHRLRRPPQFTWIALNARVRIGIGRVVVGRGVTARQAETAQELQEARDVLGHLQEEATFLRHRLSSEAERAAGVQSSADVRSMNYLQRWNCVLNEIRIQHAVCCINICMRTIAESVFI